MNDVNKIGKYIRLNWVSLVVIAVVSASVLLIIVVSGISLYHFFSIEPYLRKAIWARTPPFIFLWLFVGSFTGLINSMVWIYFVLGGGFNQLSYKRVKETEANVRWSDVVGRALIKKEVWE